MIDMSKTKRNVKSLHTFSYDGTQIRTVCEFSNVMENVSVRNSFTSVGDRSNYKTKYLHSFTVNGVRTTTNCVYNINTDHVGIYYAFVKDSSWHGGASTNTSCATWLGVNVAENVLSNVFNNVIRMPTRNHGYDFICGRGYKIDVKAACLNTRKQWAYRIDKNITADNFLCIAFDNRDDLTPMYIWLIPGKNVSHLVSTTISPHTIERWCKHELHDKIDDIIKCCNIMKDAAK